MKISALRKHGNQLAENFSKHPDVNLVGIGEKLTNGTPARRLSVTFFVENKGNPKGEMIPKKLKIETPDETRYVETDVITIAKQDMKLLSNIIDGGDIIQGLVTWEKGTLGLVFFDRKNRKKRWAITNSHVVSEIDKKLTRKEVASHGYPGGEILLGNVWRHTPLSQMKRNFADIALLEINPNFFDFSKPYQIEAWPNHQITGFGFLSPSPYAGSRRIYRYASKHPDYPQIPEIVTCHHPIEIEVGDLDAGSGQWLEYGKFFALKLHHSSTAKPREGHSGAILVREGKKKSELLVCGQIFAGGHDTIFAYSWSPISKVLKSWKSPIR